MLVLTLALLFSIKYTIEGKTLRVDYSFFYSERINIDEITEIVNTHTFLSAPAASLDRIEITYGKNCVVLSPKDKQKFVCSCGHKESMQALKTAVRKRERVFQKRCGKLYEEDEKEEKQPLNNALADALANLKL